jgi:hypothetical protein
MKVSNYIGCFISAPLAQRLEAVRLEVAWPDGRTPTRSKLLRALLQAGVEALEIKHGLRSKKD